MLTTCLECNTSFRIHAAQLGARRGMVRCGNCAAVFNAYDTLRDDAATAHEPTAPTLTEPVPAKVPETEFEMAAAPQVSVESTFDPPPDPASSADDRSQHASALDAAVRDDRADDTFATHFSIAPPEAEAEAGDTTRECADAPGVRADGEVEDAGGIASDKRFDADAGGGRRQGDTGPDDAPESSDDILFSELPAGPPPARTLLYAGLLLVSLSLASVFAIYAFRSEIVQHQPQWRPWLERACASFGCRIPLIRDLTDLRLAWSQLETDPDDPLRASLRFVLINLAGHELAWPQVILRLTDADKVTLGQRSFDPAQYLPAEFGYQAAPRDGVEQGMRPRSEHEFRVDFALDNSDAVSFEVDLRYP